MSYRDEVMSIQGSSVNDNDVGYRLGLAQATNSACEIAARADARIAELERSVVIRDMKLARLETDLELARIGARRYEVARRMNMRQWGDAHSLNLLTGKPLDQIIDDLRPFMFPQEARAGNGDKT